MHFAVANIELVASIFSRSDRALREANSWPPRSLDLTESKRGSELLRRLQNLRSNGSPSIVGKASHVGRSLIIGVTVTKHRLLPDPSEPDLFGHRGRLLGDRVSFFSKPKIARRLRSGRFSYSFNSHKQNFYTLFCSVHVPRERIALLRPLRGSLHRLSDVSDRLKGITVITLEHSIEMLKSTISFLGLGPIQRPILE